MKFTTTAALVFAVTALAPALSRATETTVTLDVERLTCPSCVYIVKAALSRVPGVRRVDVSLRGGTARVIFDDARASVEALVAATAEVGFTSAQQWEASRD